MSALAEYRPDVICHFAAQAVVGKSQVAPLDTFETNIIGTANLLEAARYLGLHNSGNFLFFYMSTDKVYGETYGSTENSGYCPTCPYSASKIAAEQIVHSYARTYGINTLIFRPCNLYGPGDYNRRVIPNTIEDVLEGRSAVLYEGDDKFYRQYLYIEDFCVILDKFLRDDWSDIRGFRGVLNISPNNSFSEDYCCSTKKVVEMVVDKVTKKMKKLGKNISLQPIATLPAKNIIEIREQWIKNSKLIGQPCMKRFKFHTLEEGLDKTIDWYIANPDFFRKMIRR